MIETVSAIFLERGRSKTAIKITSYVLLFVYISFGLSGYQPSLFGWHRLFIGSDGLAHTHTIYNSYIFIACDHVLEKHTFSFSMSIRFTNYSRKSKSQKRAFFTVSLFRIICIVLKHLSSATQFVDCRFRRDSVRRVWYAHRLRLYKWHSNTLLYNVFMNEN